MALKQSIRSCLINNVSFPRKRESRHAILLFLLLAFPVVVYAQDSVKEAEQLDFAQGLLSRGMYDMAIAQCQKFIADYPHSDSLQDAYLDLGEGYFLSQDFDKAVSAFDQFNQLYPHSDKLPVSVLRLAQIDIQEKKYDDAVKELNSVDADKDLKGGMLQSFDFYTAQAYLDKGDTASALPFFQKAADVQGAFDYTADALQQIGKIQSDNGNYSQALDAYTKSIPLATDNILKGELTYRVAEVQFLAGNYADAIKGFENILAQYPDSPLAKDALANLLLAYFNLGQYDQLLKEYAQDAAKIKDDDSFFAVHMAAVMATIELGQYTQANALLDRMLAFPALKSQETAKIFIKKAAILVRQEKYKDAMALLQAYAPQDIDDTDESFFLKGQCDFGLGDYDQAFSLFENVYLNFPNSRFVKAALLGQAHARRASGRFKESEGLFKKYYDTQPSPDLKSEALYDAVTMAAKAEDTSNVIDSAQEYLKAFPDGAQKSQVLFILADSYGKNNQPQEAIKLLQGYLSGPQPLSQPNTANFLLGFNQELLGNSDAALAAYKQVDQHNEDGKFYFAALKNMALIYLSQKNFDQAREYFDQLITQSDQNDLGIKTYIWVCNEYLKEQKYSDVLRIAAQAEKRFSPSDLEEITYFEAESLRGLGRCDEAMKDYDKVTVSTEKDVFTGSAHIGEGLCLAGSGKFEDAKKEFQKSLDENPNDYTITAHATFEMANADSSAGNWDEALKYYLLVATIYDDEHYCSESLLNAGQISERLKRRDDALKMYSEILSKYPDSPAAKTAKERMGALK